MICMDTECRASKEQVQLRTVEEYDREPQMICMDTECRASKEQVQLRTVAEYDREYQIITWVQRRT